MGDLQPARRPIPRMGISSRVLDVSNSAELHNADTDMSGYCKHCGHDRCLCDERTITDNLNTMKPIPHPELPFHIDNLKTIPLLEAQGFVGVDASLDISLFEYDCIWREIPQELRDHPDEDYLFVFSVGRVNNSPVNQFARVGMSSCDTSWINDETWASLLSTQGATKEEWMKLPYPVRVTDLYRYFGYMNIFGSTIYGGAFTIKDPNDAITVREFVDELPDPAMVGSAEYTAVYELIEDCENLEAAQAACDELRTVATDMLNKINAIL